MIRVLAIALLASAPISAQAQAIRTFVSAGGADTNDCSRFSPCRSFAAAITKTASGGEINTLDPGGYGSVTITKAISIVSGLGEAGVLVPAGGTGITINAGPSDQINLRGLAIEGAGVGKTGIKFNSGGSLVVSNSVIRNLTDNALDIEPTTASGLTVTDTLTTDNGRVGIYLYPQGGAGKIKAMIARTTASNNQWGVYANGNATPLETTTVIVSISDSVISYNIKGDGVGIYGNGAAGELETANTFISVANSRISFNSVGVKSAGTWVDLSNSSVFKNVYNDLDCNTRYPTAIRTYANNVIGNGPCTINPQSLK